MAGTFFSLDCDCGCESGLACDFQKGDFVARMVITDDNVIVARTGEELLRFFCGRPRRAFANVGAEVAGCIGQWRVFALADVGKTDLGIFEAFCGF